MDNIFGSGLRIEEKSVKLRGKHRGEQPGLRKIWPAVIGGIKIKRRAVRPHTLGALEDRGDASPAANAHRGETVATGDAL